MRTFASNDHDAFYGVPRASVVLAETEEEARQKLDVALVKAGLKPFAQEPYTLREIQPGQAVVLATGDY